MKQEDLKKNYNLSDIENLFEEITKIIYYYFESNSETNKDYDYTKPEKKFRMDYVTKKVCLSSGKNFEYTVPKSSLAHLLGINTEYYARVTNNPEKSSYELLKTIVDNPYKTHNDPRVDINELLSPYVEKKVAAFYTNTAININNIDFICEYDYGRTYQDNVFDCKNMNYLVLQHDAEKYYILTLTKDNNGYNRYVPVSSQVFDSKAELMEKLPLYLKNQQISLVVSIYAKPNENSFWVNSYELVDRVKDLQNWGVALQCIPNVTDSLIRNLDKLNDSKIEKNNLSEKISKIAERMKNGETINLNDFGYMLSDDVLNLLKAYNESRKITTDETISKQNNSLKKRVEMLEEKVENVKEDKEQLEEKYRDLEADKMELASKIENALNALK